MTVAPGSAPSVVKIVQRDDLVFIEHEFNVPLRHSIATSATDGQESETISVFVREVVTPATYRNGSYLGLPALLFLQGGPGGASPRPVSPSGWLGTALDKGFRVLLLDQRGTGRSTPVTASLLAAKRDAAAQAEYLSWHRADNIVADCEFIRAALLPLDPATQQPQTWTTLGQSYGGFCTLTYLSFAPQGLRECMFTGGLAALEIGPDAVYQRTFDLMRARNLEFYRQYPHLKTVVANALRLCAESTVTLPHGERLTPERLTSLGMALGSGTGLHDLAWLFEAPFAPTNSPSTHSQACPSRFTDEFLHQVQSRLGFATAPLYAVMHESIYQDGQNHEPSSNWSAHRVRQTLPDFNAPGTATDAVPQYFVGESIEPWMFIQDKSLHPYAAAAKLLAAKSNWGPLYDLATLRKNTVRCAAAVYHDDIFVPLDTSLQTAATIGAKTLITNQLQHDGLRADGELFGQLLQLVRG